MPRTKRKRPDRFSAVEAPEPAPGDLDKVQAFINTRGGAADADELASPQALSRWLSHHGLLEADVELTEDDRRRAIAVRESLYALVRANTGSAVGEAVVRRLEKATDRARFRLSFDGSIGVAVVPASRSFDDALGALLAVVAAAQLEGLWPRFKACARGSCPRVFFDASRTRGMKWCSRRCGERTRREAFRRRRQA